MEDLARRAPRRRGSPRAAGAGFEFSVWTPFSVRVVSIRYSATVSSSSSRVRAESLLRWRRARRPRAADLARAGRADPGRQIDVEERRSEEEHRDRAPCRQGKSRHARSCCRPAGGAGSPSRAAPRPNIRTSVASPPNACTRSARATAIRPRERGHGAEILHRPPPARRFRTSARTTIAASANHGKRNAAGRKTTVPTAIASAQVARPDAPRDERSGGRARQR